MMGIVFSRQRTPSIMKDSTGQPTPRDTGRPLSPHIGVYRWQITMVMSILHRITGGALTVGLLIVTWGLVAAAMGPEQWSGFADLALSPFGRIVLFAWSVALYYHTFNGLRHLMWDTGHWLTIPNLYRSGYAVLALTALATAITWFFALT